MIEIISTYMLNFLTKKCHILPDERDIYFYGINIMIYTIFSTFGLVFLGILRGQLIESTLIIAIYYINQTLGGGFHASSHLGCFLTMSIGLLQLLLLLRYFNYLQVYIIIGFLSLSILFLCPLILHKNKEYLQPHFHSLSTRSVSALIIQLLFYIIIIYTQNIMLIGSISAGFMACAISRSIAFIQFKIQDD